jgi:uncharacterized damage-inducible protein DinB
MTEKKRLLKTFKDEHAVTVKVMKAYPSDKLNWRPHERSFNARQLMMRFMGEQVIMAKLPKGGFTPPTEQPEEPELNLDQLLDTFEKGYAEVLKVIEGVPDSDFDNKMTLFFGSEMKLSDACWIPIKDQIHHRGQLSVYIRMAGGKVPSIYGPSADDPGM